MFRGRQRLIQRTVLIGFSKVATVSGPKGKETTLRGSKDKETTLRGSKDKETTLRGSKDKETTQSVDEKAKRL